MKNVNLLGLFDDHFLMEKLTKLGDPLQKLSNFIDWDIFKTPLNKAFSDETKNRSKEGRASFDKLVLFKALLIQSLYNLSDDQLECQITDRASFKRFLGLKKSDKVPDSKTFWHYREQLIEKDVIMGLFTTFNETLDAAGVFANEGKMVDVRQLADGIPPPAEHPRRKQAHKRKRHRTRSMERETAQALPKRCGCTVDQEK